MGRVNLHTVVMAHESRRAMAEKLADSLDSKNGVFLSVDDGTLGRWGNGRRCLLSAPATSTHCLVIQDDAVPAADLLEGLEQWLPRLPHSILCLYSGRVRPWRVIHERHAQPPCWLQMSAIQWGVALVVPTEIIKLTVNRGDQLSKIGNYDMRLGYANASTFKLPVLYPSPSWVNHRETPSTVPGRKPNRFALSALDPDQSVLDWAREAPIIRVPDFQRKPAGQQYYR